MGRISFPCIFNDKMKFGRGAGLAVRMTHGVRRRGRAVAASPPHMKDHSLRKSIKIKDGTNASENFRVVRFETDGAETQLSPINMPIDAINDLVQSRTVEAILTS
jgi:hypothetical protein